MTIEYGKILRIEKTSIHDGDGLRTVVFFKGCPLKCKWCSTPESQKMECEFDFGMDMSAEQVIKDICRDEIFFFHSGGGVTLSGGEVLMQTKFAKAILLGCRERGIHTALETSLLGRYEEIETLLPYLNAIYLDFKIFEDERHVLYTGVSNTIIKENIIRLHETYSGEIHIRIPTIPTVNMFCENMEKTAEFLRPLTKVKDVELLAYHRLGMDSYRKLNLAYELKDIETPSKEEMEEMANVFATCLPSCPVKINGKVYG